MVNWLIRAYGITLPVKNCSGCKYSNTQLTNFLINSMILPIIAYGNPILRKVCRDIFPGDPELDTFIEDMWETMYASNGVGLAAPQVNRDIRLFLVDSMQIFRNMEEEERGQYPDMPGIKQV